MLNHSNAKKESIRDSNKLLLFIINIVYIKILLNNKNLNKSEPIFLFLLIKTKQVKFSLWWPMLLIAKRKKNSTSQNVCFT